MIVFSDEIYEKLVYDGLKFVSFATLHPSLLERTLTFNCHSKSFAMTGWRIGYIGGPKPVIDAINKLQSQMTSHITSFTQPAAAAALNDPRGAGVDRADAQAVRAARPAHVGAADRAAEGHLRPTAGRVLLLPQRQRLLRQVQPWPQDHRRRQLRRRPARTEPRRVVPGNDSGFDTHVRLSFATSMEQIDKGIDRIQRFLQDLR